MGRSEKQAGEMLHATPHYYYYWYGMGNGKIPSGAELGLVGCVSHLTGVRESDEEGGNSGERGWDWLDSSFRLSFKGDTGETEGAGQDR